MFHLKLYKLYVNFIKNSSENKIKMKIKANFLFLLGILTILSACGKEDQVPNSDNVGQVVSDQNVVIRSRLVIELNTNTAAKTQNQLAANIPITVTNSPYASMTIDSREFLIPSISNTVLNFGTLKVTDLSDNNLKICGTSGNKKCNTAFIRMYTTGVNGAGMYNSVDGYGVPITAGSVGSNSYGNVGLNPEGALVLQSATIDSSQHVMRLSNFSSAQFNIKVDFSNAGAGDYSTNLVLEYGLSL
jgi:hypothetical protein